MPNEYTDKKVWSRDAKIVGVATGNSHECRMESCRGARVTVKWPDGSITYPCTRGLASYGEGFKIV